MQVRSHSALCAVQPALYFTPTDPVAGEHVNSTVPNTHNQIQGRTQAPRLDFHGLVSFPFTRKESGLLLTLSLILSPCHFACILIRKWLYHLWPRSFPKNAFTAFLLPDRCPLSRSVSSEAQQCPWVATSVCGGRAAGGMSRGLQEWDGEAGEGSLGRLGQQCAGLWGECCGQVRTVNTASADNRTLKTTWKLHRERLARLNGSGLSLPHNTMIPLLKRRSCYRTKHLWWTVCKNILPHAHILMREREGGERER